MKGGVFSFVCMVALAFLGSCNTTKQLATASHSIEGTYWKLIELNGKPVPPPVQLNKEPHILLNASEKRVNGNSGCNSFFGSYELQDSSITFLNMGATKMACPGGAMQLESQLFQAFALTKKFTRENDTLVLTGTDRSTLAKFVMSNQK